MSIITSTDLGEDFSLEGFSLTSFAVCDECGATVTDESTTCVDCELDDLLVWLRLA